MAANYGVNVEIIAKAAKPVMIQSVTPVGIAGTAKGVENGLQFFNNVSSALEMFRAKEGSILNALKSIDMQGVETPVIVSVFEVDKSNADDAAPAQEAVDAFEKSSAVTGYIPNIIIAPEWSDKLPVINTMKKVAEKLKATAIIDLAAKSQADAKVKLNSVPASKRLLICDPSVAISLDKDNKPVYTPLSPCVAGMIARTDGESEYGFSNSFSNRVVGGVIETERPVEFVMGESCEADELRSMGITTVFRYSGFRAWGGETRDDEPIWRDLTRVRIFDRVAEACQKGVFYAIDRKASELFYAKLSVEELLRGLIGAKALIGYKVFWDADRNTEATITQGKFYLNVEMQNNPITKTLQLEFAYVDKYGKNLMDELAK